MELDTNGLYDMASTKISKMTLSGKKQANLYIKGLNIVQDNLYWDDKVPFVILNLI